MENVKPVDVSGIKRGGGYLKVKINELATNSTNELCELQPFNKSE
jgi:hypothetical protein